MDVLKQQQTALNLKTIQLNKLLKSTKKLSLKDTVLVNLLVELIDNNYNFTPQQFDMFVNQICYKNGKLPCYLIWQEEKPVKIIKYMITHYDITPKQMTNICYAIGISSGGHYIIDILFRNKYNFTIEHFKLLGQAKYKCPEIDDYNLLHNNVIFSACLDIINNRHENWKNFKDCILLVENNTNIFDIQQLEIILCFLSITKHTIINYKSLNILLDGLFLNHVDKNQIFQLIMKDKNFVSNLCVAVISYIINKFDYDVLFAEYVCENIISYEPHIIFDLMIKGHKITTSNLNAILKNFDVITLVYDNRFVSIGLPNKYFTKCKIGNTHFIIVVNLFEIFKLLPDIDTLNIACKKDNIQNVNIIIQKYNVIPDKSTLDICSASRNYNFINTIINYKITPDKYTLKILCSNIPNNLNSHENIKKIVELFIEHGLVINIKIFTYLALKGILLDDLERFDIKYDEQIYFLCYLNDQFTDRYQNKFIFDTNIIALHKLCRKRSITYDKVITFLKNNNVKLDRFALDLIYDRTPSLGAKFTNDHGCMPSVLTLNKRFIVGPYFGSPKLRVSPEYLVKNYKLTAADMFETYEINL